MTNKIKALSVFLILLILLFISIISLPKFQLLPNNNVAVSKILDGIFNPNWSILNLVLELWIITFAMAILGTILSILTAIPIAAFSSRKVNVKNYKKVDWTSPFLRTLPDLLIGMIMVSIIGPGNIAGVLTIFVASLGSSIKFIKEMLNKNSKTMYAQNYSILNSKSKMLYFTIIGANANEFVSNVITKFETNLRIAVIVGFVGAGGIGNLLFKDISVYNFNDAFVIIYTMIIIFIIVDYVSIWLRNKFK